jgi:tetratricopeptide (TPR) repeat protein
MSMADDVRMEAEPVPETPEAISTPAESVSGVEAEVKAQPEGRTPLLTRLRRWLGVDRQSLAERLAELDRAVEAAPESSANLILRGEALLDMGSLEQAEVDFQRGLELAEAELERSAWGVMEQALRDRALMGLERIRQGRR